MSSHDLTYLCAGAALGFGAGLAAVAKDPNTALKWGVALSVGAFCVFFILDWYRRGWVSADVTLSESTTAGHRVEVGVRNHGHYPQPLAVLNILVSDRFELIVVDAQGNPKDDPEILETSEAIDGVHGSRYWQKAIQLPPGSGLVHLLVQGQAPGFVVRVSYGVKRYDAWLSIREPNVTRTHDFALLKPRLSRAWGAVWNKLPWVRSDES